MQYTIKTVFYFSAGQIMNAYLVCMCFEVEGTRWLTGTYRTQTCVAVPWRASLEGFQGSFIFTLWM